MESVLTIAVRLAAPRPPAPIKATRIRSLGEAPRSELGQAIATPPTAVAVVRNWRRETDEKPGARPRLDMAESLVGTKKTCDSWAACNGARQFKPSATPHGKRHSVNGCGF